MEQVEAQEYLAHLVHQVHPGNLDAQVIQDKVLQDLQVHKVRQVMEDQVLKETKGIQVLHPVLDHTLVDHRGHLGLLDRRDPQVLLDQEGIKVSQVNQEEALRQFQLMVEHTQYKDHQDHQDLLDVQDHRDIKVTLDLLVLQVFLALQEAKAFLVPRVLLVLQASQAPLLPPVTCGSTSLTI